MYLLYYRYTSENNHPTVRSLLLMGMAMEMEIHSSSKLTFTVLYTLPFFDFLVLLPLFTYFKLSRSA